MSSSNGRRNRISSLNPIVSSSSSSSSNLKSKSNLVNDESLIQSKSNEMTSGKLSATTKSVTTKSSTTKSSTTKSSTTKSSTTKTPTTKTQRLYSVEIERELSVEAAIENAGIQVMSLASHGSSLSLERIISTVRSSLEDALKLPVSIGLPINANMKQIEFHSDGSYTKRIVKYGESSCFHAIEKKQLVIEETNDDETRIFIPMMSSTTVHGIIEIQNLLPKSSLYDHQLRRNVDILRVLISSKNYDALYNLHFWKQIPLTVYSGIKQNKSSTLPVRGYIHDIIHTKNGIPYYGGPRFHIKWETGKIDEELTSNDLYLLYCETSESLGSVVRFDNKLLQQLTRFGIQVGLLLESRKVEVFLTELRRSISRAQLNTVGIVEVALQSMPQALSAMRELVLIGQKLDGELRTLINYDQTRQLSADERKIRSFQYTASTFIQQHVLVDTMDTTTRVNDAGNTIWLGLELVMPAGFVWGKNAEYLRYFIVVHKIDDTLDVSENQNDITISDGTETNESIEKSEIQELVEIARRSIPRTSFDEKILRGVMHEIERAIALIWRMNQRRRAFKDAIKQLEIKIFEWNHCPSIEIIYNFLHAIPDDLLRAHLYCGLLEPGAQTIKFVSAKGGSQMEGRRLKRGVGVSFKVIDAGKPLLFDQQDFERKKLLVEGAAVHVRYGRAPYSGRITRYRGHEMFDVLYDCDEKVEAGVPASRITPQNMAANVHLWDSAQLPFLCVPIRHRSKVLGVLSLDTVDSSCRIEGLQSLDADLSGFVESLGKILGTALDEKVKDAALHSLYIVAKNQHTEVSDLLRALFDAVFSVSMYAESIVAATLPANSTQKLAFWPRGRQIPLATLASRGELNSEVTRKLNEFDLTRYGKKMVHRLGSSSIILFSRVKIANDGDAPGTDGSPESFEGEEKLYVIAASFLAPLPDADVEFFSTLQKQFSSLLQSVLSHKASGQYRQEAIKELQSICNYSGDQRSRLASRSTLAMARALLPDFTHLLRQDLFRQVTEVVQTCYHSASLYAAVLARRGEELRYVMESPSIRMVGNRLTRKERSGVSFIAIDDLRPLCVTAGSALSYSLKHFGEKSRFEYPVVVIPILVGIDTIVGVLTGVHCGGQNSAETAEAVSSLLRFFASVANSLGKMMRVLKAEEYGLRLREIVASASGSQDGGEAIGEALLDFLPSGERVVPIGYRPAILPTKQFSQMCSRGNRGEVVVLFSVLGCHLSGEVSQYCGLNVGRQPRLKVICQGATLLDFLLPVSISWMNTPETRTDKNTPNGVQQDNQIFNDVLLSQFAASPIRVAPLKLRLPTSVSPGDTALRFVLVVGDTRDNTETILGEIAISLHTLTHVPATPQRYTLFSTSTKSHISSNVALAALSVTSRLLYADTVAGFSLSNITLNLPLTWREVVTPKESGESSLDIYLLIRWRGTIVGRTKVSSLYATHGEGSQSKSIDSSSPKENSTVDYMFWSTLDLFCPMRSDGSDESLIVDVWGANMSRGRDTFLGSVSIPLVVLWALFHPRHAFNASSKEALESVDFQWKTDGSVSVTTATEYTEELSGMRLRLRGTTVLADRLNESQIRSTLRLPATNSSSSTSENVNDGSVSGQLSKKKPDAIPEEQSPNFLSQLPLTSVAALSPTTDFVSCELVILSARDLLSPIGNAKSLAILGAKRGELPSVYVSVTLNGEEVGTTSVQRETHTPRWPSDEATFRLLLPSGLLRNEVEKGILSGRSTQSATADAMLVLEMFSVDESGSLSERLGVVNITGATLAEIFLGTALHRKWFDISLPTDRNGASLRAAYSMPRNNRLWTPQIFISGRPLTVRLPPPPPVPPIPAAVLHGRIRDENAADPGYLTFSIESLSKINRSLFESYGRYNDIAGRPAAAIPGTDRLCIIVSITFNGRLLTETAPASLARTIQWLPRHSPAEGPFGDAAYGYNSSGILISEPYDIPQTVVYDEEERGQIKTGSATVSLRLPTGKSLFSSSLNIDILRQDDASKLAAAESTLMGSLVISGSDLVSLVGRKGRISRVFTVQHVSSEANLGELQLNVGPSGSGRIYDYDGLSLRLDILAAMRLPLWPLRVEDDVVGGSTTRNTVNTSGAGSRRITTTNNSSLSALSTAITTGGCQTSEGRPLAFAVVLWNGEEAGRTAVGPIGSSVLWGGERFILRVPISYGVSDRVGSCALEILICDATPSNQHNRSLVPQRQTSKDSSSYEGRRVLGRLRLSGDWLESFANSIPPFSLWFELTSPTSGDAANSRILSGATIRPVGASSNLGGTVDGVVFSSSRGAVKMRAELLRPSEGGERAGEIVDTTSAISLPTSSTSTYTSIAHPSTTLLQSTDPSLDYLLTLISADGLVNTDGLGSANAYCRVTWQRRDIGFTQVIRRTRSPKWKEEHFLLSLTPDLSAHANGVYGVLPPEEWRESIIDEIGSSGGISGGGYGDSALQLTISVYGFVSGSRVFLGAVTLGPDELAPLLSQADALAEAAYNITNGLTSGCGPLAVYDAALSDTYNARSTTASTEISNQTTMGASYSSSVVGVHEDSQVLKLPVSNGSLACLPTHATSIVETAIRGVESVFPLRRSHALTDSENASVGGHLRFSLHRLRYEPAMGGNGSLLTTATVWINSITTLPPLNRQGNIPVTYIRVLRRYSREGLVLNTESFSPVSGSAGTKMSGDDANFSSNEWVEIHRTKRVTSFAPVWSREFVPVAIPARSAWHGFALRFEICDGSGDVPSHGTTTNPTKASSALLQTSTPVVVAATEIWDENARKLLTRKGEAVSQFQYWTLHYAPTYKNLSKLTGVPLKLSLGGGLKSAWDIAERKVLLAATRAEAAAAAVVPNRLHRRELSISSMSLSYSALDTLRYTRRYSPPGSPSSPAPSSPITSYRTNQNEPSFRKSSRRIDDSLRSVRKSVSGDQLDEDGTGDGEDVSETVEKLCEPMTIEERETAVNEMNQALKIASMDGFENLASQVSNHRLALTWRGKTLATMGIRLTADGIVTVAVANRVMSPRSSPHPDNSSITDKNANTAPTVHRIGENGSAGLLLAPPDTPVESARLVIELQRRRAQTEIKPTMLSNSPNSVHSRHSKRQKKRSNSASAWETVAMGNVQCRDLLDVMDSTDSLRVVLVPLSSSVEDPSESLPSPPLQWVGLSLSDSSIPESVDKDDEELRLKSFSQDLQGENLNNERFSRISFLFSRFNVPCRPRDLSVRPSVSLFVRVEFAATPGSAALRESVKRKSVEQSIRSVSSDGTGDTGSLMSSSLVEKEDTPALVENWIVLGETAALNLTGNELVFLSGERFIADKSQRVPVVDCALRLTIVGKSLNSGEEKSLASTTIRGEDLKALLVSPDMANNISLSPMIGTPSVLLHLERKTVPDRTHDSFEDNVTDVHVRMPGGQIASAFLTDISAARQWSISLRCQALPNLSSPLFDRSLPLPASLCEVEVSLISAHNLLQPSRLLSLPLWTSESSNTTKGVSDATFAVIRYGGSELIATPIVHGTNSGAIVWSQNYSATFRFPRRFLVDAIKEQIRQNVATSATRSNPENGKVGDDLWMACDGVFGAADLELSIALYARRRFGSPTLLGVAELDGSFLSSMLSDGVAVHMETIPLKPSRHLKPSDQPMAMMISQNEDSNRPLLSVVFQRKDAIESLSHDGRSAMLAILSARHLRALLSSPLYSSTSKAVSLLSSTTPTEIFVRLRLNGKLLDSTYGEPFCDTSHTESAANSPVAWENQVFPLRLPSYLFDPQTFNLHQKGIISQYNKYSVQNESSNDPHGVSTIPGNNKTSLKLTNTSPPNEIYHSINNDKVYQTENSYSSADLFSGDVITFGASLAIEMWCRNGSNGRELLIGVFKMDENILHRLLCGLDVPEDYGVVTCKMGSTDTQSGPQGPSQLLKLMSCDWLPAAVQSHPNFGTLEVVLRSADITTVFVSSSNSPKTPLQKSIDKTPALGELRKYAIWVHGLSDLVGVESNSLFGGRTAAYTVVTWNGREVGRNTPVAGTLTPRWHPPLSEGLLFDSRVAQAFTTTRASKLHALPTTSSRISVYNHNNEVAFISSTLQQQAFMIALPALSDIVTSGAELRFEVYNYRRFRRDDFLGGITFTGPSLASLLESATNAGIVGERKLFSLGMLPERLSQGHKEEFVGGEIDFSIILQSSTSEDGISAGVDMNGQVSLSVNRHDLSFSNSLSIDDSSFAVRWATQADAMRGTTGSALQLSLCSADLTPALHYPDPSGENTDQIPSNTWSLGSALRSVGTKIGDVVSGNKEDGSPLVVRATIEWCGELAAVNDTSDCDTNIHGVPECVLWKPTPLLLPLPSQPAMQPLAASALIIRLWLTHADNLSSPGSDGWEWLGELRLTWAEILRVHSGEYVLPLRLSVPPDVGDGPLRVRVPTEISGEGFVKKEADSNNGNWFGKATNFLNDTLGSSSTHMNELKDNSSSYDCSFSSSQPAPYWPPRCYDADVSLLSDNSISDSANSKKGVLLWRGSVRLSLRVVLPFFDFSAPLRDHSFRRTLRVLSAANLPFAGSDPPSSRVTIFINGVAVLRSSVVPSHADPHYARVATEFRVDPSSPIRVTVAVSHVLLAGTAGANTVSTDSGSLFSLMNVGSSSSAANAAGRVSLTHGEVMIGCEDIPIDSLLRPPNESFDVFLGPPPASAVAAATRAGLSFAMSGSVKLQLTAVDRVSEDNEPFAVSASRQQNSALPITSKNNLGGTPRKETKQALDDGNQSNNNNKLLQGSTLWSTFAVHRYVYDEPYNEESAKLLAYRRFAISKCISNEENQLFGAIPSLSVPVEASLSPDWLLLPLAAVGLQVGNVYVFGPPLGWRDSFAMQRSLAPHLTTHHGSMYSGQGNILSNSTPPIHEKYAHKKLASSDVTMLEDISSATSQAILRLRWKDANRAARELATRLLRSSLRDLVLDSTNAQYGVPLNFSGFTVFYPDSTGGYSVRKIPPLGSVNGHLFLARRLSMMIAAVLHSLLPGITVHLAIPTPDGASVVYEALLSPSQTNQTELAEPRFGRVVSGGQVFLPIELGGASRLLGRCDRRVEAIVTTNDFRSTVALPPPPISSDSPIANYHPLFPPTRDSQWNTSAALSSAGKPLGGGALLFSPYGTITWPLIRTAIGSQDSNIAFLSLCGLSSASSNGVSAAEESLLDTSAWADWLSSIAESAGELYTNATENAALGNLSAYISNWDADRGDGLRGVLLRQLANSTNGGRLFEILSVQPKKSKITSLKCHVRPIDPISAAMVGATIIISAFSFSVLDRSLCDIGDNQEDSEYNEDGSDLGGGKHSPQNAGGLLGKASKLYRQVAAATSNQNRAPSEPSPSHPDTRGYTNKPSEALSNPHFNSGAGVGELDSEAIRRIFHAAPILSTTATDGWVFSVTGGAGVEQVLPLVPMNSKSHSSGSIEILVPEDGLSTTPDAHFQLSSPLVVPIPSSNNAPLHLALYYVLPNLTPIIRFTATLPITPDETPNFQSQPSLNIANESGMNSVPPGERTVIFRPTAFSSTLMEALAGDRELLNSRNGGVEVPTPGSAVTAQFFRSLANMKLTAQLRLAFDDGTGVLTEKTALHGLSLNNDRRRPGEQDVSGLDTVLGGFGRRRRFDESSLRGIKLFISNANGLSVSLDANRRRQSTTTIPTKKAVDVQSSVPVAVYCEVRVGGVVLATTETIRNGGDSPQFESNLFIPLSNEVSKSVSTTQNVLSRNLPLNRSGQAVQQPRNLAANLISDGLSIDVMERPLVGRGKFLGRVTISFDSLLTSLAGKSSAGLNAFDEASSDSNQQTMDIAGASDIILSDEVIDYPLLHRSDLPTKSQTCVGGNLRLAAHLDLFPVDYVPEQSDQHLGDKNEPVSMTHSPRSKETTWTSQMKQELERIAAMINPVLRFTICRATNLRSAGALNSRPTAMYASITTLQDAITTGSPVGLNLDNPQHPQWPAQFCTKSSQTQCIGLTREVHEETRTPIWNETFDVSLGNGLSTKIGTFPDDANTESTQIANPPEELLQELPKMTVEIFSTHTLLVGPFSQGVVDLSPIDLLKASNRLLTFPLRASATNGDRYKNNSRRGKKNKNTQKNGTVIGPEVTLRWQVVDLGRESTTTDVNMHSRLPYQFVFSSPRRLARIAQVCVQFLAATAIPVSPSALGRGIFASQTPSVSALSTLSSLSRHTEHLVKSTTTSGSRPRSKGVSTSTFVSNVKRSPTSSLQAINPENAPFIVVRYCGEEKARIVASLYRPPRKQQRRRRRNRNRESTSVDNSAVDGQDESTSGAPTRMLGLLSSVFKDSSQDDMDGDNDLSNVEEPSGSSSTNATLANNEYSSSAWLFSSSVSFDCVFDGELSYAPLTIELWSRDLFGHATRIAVTAIPSLDLLHPATGKLLYYAFHPPRGGSSGTGRGLAVGGGADFNFSLDGGESCLASGQESLFHADIGHGALSVAMSRKWSFQHVIPEKTCHRIPFSRFRADIGGSSAILSDDTSIDGTKSKELVISLAPEARLENERQRKEGLSLPSLIAAASTAAGRYYSSPFERLDVISETHFGQLLAAAHRAEQTIMKGPAADILCVPLFTRPIISNSTKTEIGEAKEEEVDKEPTSQQPDLVVESTTEDTTTTTTTTEKELDKGHNPSKLNYNADDDFEANLTNISAINELTVPEKNIPVPNSPHFLAIRYSPGRFSKREARFVARLAASYRDAVATLHRRSQRRIALRQLTTSLAALTTSQPQIFKGTPLGIGPAAAASPAELLVSALLDFEIAVQCPVRCYLLTEDGRSFASISVDDTPKSVAAATAIQPLSIPGTGSNNDPHGSTRFAPSITSSTSHGGNIGVDRSRATVPNVIKHLAALARHGLMVQWYRDKCLFGSLHWNSKFSQLDLPSPEAVEEFLSAIEGPQFIPALLSSLRSTYPSGAFILPMSLPGEQCFGVLVVASANRIPSAVYEFLDTSPLSPKSSHHPLHPNTTATAHPASPQSFTSTLNNPQGTLPPGSALLCRLESVEHDIANQLLLSSAHLSAALFTARSANLLKALTSFPMKKSSNPRLLLRYAFRLLVSAFPAIREVSVWIISHPQAEKVVSSALDQLSSRNARVRPLGGMMENLAVTDSKLSRDADKSVGVEQSNNTPSLLRRLFRFGRRSAPSEQKLSNDEISIVSSNPSMGNIPSQPSFIGQLDSFADSAVNKYIICGVFGNESPDSLLRSANERNLHSNTTSSTSSPLSARANPTPVSARSGRTSTSELLRVSLSQQRDISGSISSPLLHQLGSPKQQTPAPLNISAEEQAEWKLTVPSVVFEATSDTRDCHAHLRLTPPYTGKTPYLSRMAIVYDEISRATDVLSCPLFRVSTGQTLIRIGDKNAIAHRILATQVFTSEDLVYDTAPTPQSIEYDSDDPEMNTSRSDDVQSSGFTTPRDKVVSPRDKIFPPRSGYSSPHQTSRKNPTSSRQPLPPSLEGLAISSRGTGRIQPPMLSGSPVPPSARRKSTRSTVSRVTSNRSIGVHGSPRPPSHSPSKHGSSSPNNISSPSSYDLQQQKFFLSINTHDIGRDSGYGYIGPEMEKVLLAVATLLESNFAKLHRLQSDEQHKKTTSGTGIANRALSPR